MFYFKMFLDNDIYYFTVLLVLIIQFKEEYLGKTVRNYIIRKTLVSGRIYNFAFTYVHSISK